MSARRHLLAEVLPGGNDSIREQGVGTEAAPSCFATLPLLEGIIHEMNCN